MPQLDTATLQKVFDDYRTRKITNDQFMAAVKTLYKESGFDDAQAASLANDYLSYARTGKSLNGPALAPFDNPLQPVPSAPLYGGVVGGGGKAGDLASANLEAKTDPFTAYLSRLGIGGKQFYNPGEAYQANLFDPYKAQYDIQERLNAPGASYQNTSRQSPNFNSFLDARGGGLGGLISGAQSQLTDIFRGTQAQKTSTYNPGTGNYGLGYEPGQGLPNAAGVEPSTMDSGQLAELQDLFKYGLRGQVGSLGAAYASKALPQAQQAYYGQKQAGNAGASNFLDWLQRNWQLGF